MIAVVLMVIGIAVVGAITSSIAARIVEQVQHERSPEGARDYGGVSSHAV